jgi:triphosphoribosyl-dephospho-CoA synthase
MKIPCAEAAEPLYSPFIGSPALNNYPLSVGRAALQALHQELSAYPKPGLVSPVDCGSHDDMDAATFFRSLFALRSYFCEVALAGMQGASFSVLQRLGFTAEERMLRATQGVNTHRGAIFNLGLLAAGSGFLMRYGMPLEREALSRLVSERWGKMLLLHGESLPKTSHGSLVALRYGIGGAREEAAAGFPHLFEVALPELEHSLRLGMDMQLAAVQCLFRLISVMPDSNLLYRGGEEGLLFAQTTARGFLDAGGVNNPEWRGHAVSIHREFVARKLSPGGSADLLAATLFVHRLLLIKNSPVSHRI